MGRKEVPGELTPPAQIFLEFQTSYATELVYKTSLGNCNRFHVSLEVDCSHSMDRVEKY